MKHLLKYTAAALFAGLAFTACSPEEFEGADQNGLPTMDGVDFELAVDQEVNQIQVKVAERNGYYPIWIFNGATYSTLNEAGWSNTERGTYTVELKMGNRNGISQRGIEKTFTFNETKVDYTAEFKRITGKEWRFANAEEAHLACGPLGRDGRGWWSAAPDEKKGTGMYDDRITFTADNNKGGTYTYNPGEDGLTYVNQGVTKWGGPQSADFDAEIGAQTAGWQFEAGTWTDSEGQTVSVTYLVLDAGTVFPYISSDKQLSEPRFRIETLTAKKMVLIYENTDGDGIAWRFIFTSEEAEVPFQGFDANSDFNMFKGVTPTMSFYYNPDPSWGAEQTNGGTLASLFKAGNNDYDITVSDQCYADWQAQVHFHTDLVTTADKHYDFSVILTADQNIDGVIIKLTDEADGAALLEEHVNLKADEEYVLWKSDLVGIDLNKVKLATDYGHATGLTHINLRNIVLKDHANDDGTVLPGNEGDDDDNDPTKVTWVAVDSPDNLGAAFNTKGVMEFWWATADWQRIGDPDFSYADGVYTITGKDATTAEWQAQNSIHNVDINIEEGQGYDISVKIVSNMDLDRYTLKLCEETNDDNTLLYKGDLALEKGVNIVQFANLKCMLKDAASSFSTAKFFVDLGGCPVGVQIQLSDIIVQKHVKVDPNAPFDYNSAANIWKAIDDNKDFTETIWFGDAGWQGVYEKTDIVSHDGSSHTIKVPVAVPAEQWHGQWKLFPNGLKAAADDVFDISVKVSTTGAVPCLTFKVTDNNDDNNFFCAEKVAIEDADDYLFRIPGAKLSGGKDASSLQIVFDVSGAEVGTTVTFSEITLIKK